MYVFQFGKNHVNSCDRYQESFFRQYRLINIMFNKPGWPYLWINVHS